MKATLNTTALFPNLYAHLCSEIDKQAEETKKQISEAVFLNALDNWHIKSFLPSSKKLHDFETLESAKAYLLKRVEKHTQKRKQKELLHLLEVEQANEFKYFNISVEWKKNRTWGANPTAEGYDYNGHYNSGSIGGCGYDKLSTAVANVLNQSLALKKALYLEREKDLSKSLREQFGYGSGYRLLPYFEGGVGVSCYPEIFKKIGFTFRQTASGKTFDAFEVTKTINP